MIRFVSAVEHLSQGLYRYGLRPPQSVMMPIVRLPVPENPNPEPIDYQSSAPWFSHSMPTSPARKRR